MSNYKTYNINVGTFNTKPLEELHNMINKGVIKDGVLITLSYSSFNFDGSNYIPGLDNITLNEINQIIYFVHLNNGKIILSIGGENYNFYGSSFYEKGDVLAYYINLLLKSYNFDGVNFDIQDHYNIVPNNFSDNVGLLINSLRNINNNLYITLTTVTSTFCNGYYHKKVIDLTLESLNGWIPMKYDLGNDLTNNLIECDINFYINYWNIPRNKLILYLLHNENNNNIKNLISFVLNNNLGGLFINNISNYYHLEIQNILYDNDNDNIFRNKRQKLNH